MFCKRCPLVAHYISFPIEFTKARLSYCRCDFDPREDLRERPGAKDHFLASSLRFWSKSSPSSEISTQNVLIGSNILLLSFHYPQARSTKNFCQNILFFARLISWCISLPLMFDARLILLSQHILLPSCYIFTIYFIFVCFWYAVGFFFHSTTFSQAAIGISTGACPAVRGHSVLCTKYHMHDFDYHDHDAGCSYLLSHFTLQTAFSSWPLPIPQL